jgi:hypothetical protein
MILVKALVVPSSTVVEHLAQIAKIKGLNPATGIFVRAIRNWAWAENMVRSCTLFSVYQKLEPDPALALDL